MTDEDDDDDRQIDEQIQFIYLDAVTLNIELGNLFVLKLERANYFYFFVSIPLQDTQCSIIVVGKWQFSHLAYSDVRGSTVRGEVVFRFGVLTKGSVQSKCCTYTGPQTGSFQTSE